MADGVGAVGTVAVDLPDLACLWPVERCGVEEQRYIPPGSAGRRVSRDMERERFCLRRSHILCPH